MKVGLIEYRPPRIAMAMVAIAVAFQLFWPASRAVVFATPFVGVVFAIAGFSLMTWAWWLFKTTGVAICPTSHTSRLLTRGAYRFTRNPMYLGLIAMLLGLALAIGTAPFYLVVVLYFVVINSVFCPYEEAKLRQLFDGQYAEYESQVRRWL